MLATLESNTIFARNYRVVRLLAAGGMGAVYEVRHVGTDKRWALKVMHPSLASDRDAVERFRREAQVDSIIDSAVVVSVIDSGVDEASQTPFLVMEFLVGEDLGQRLDRHERATPQQVVAWLHQVAIGLDKAHAKGIIHRDLKPENLFLVRSDELGERVKILDFGIAKLVQSANQSSTESGGTPQFMAPEQTRRGREVGPWTDVWALGLIAYALLVGRGYWLANSIGELYGELIDEGERESPTLRAGRYGVTLPPAFDAWFFRCVHNDRNRRFLRAGEAVAALASVLGVASPRSIEEPVAPGGVEWSARGSADRYGVETNSASASAAPSGARARAQPPTTSAPIAQSDPTPPAQKAKAPPIVAISIAALVAIGVGGGALAMRSGATADRSRGSDDEGKSTGSERTKKAAAAPSLRDRIEAEVPFVALDGFSLQRTEVTRGAYSIYVESLPHDARPAARPLKEWNGEPDDPSTAKRPVTWITWARADRFCKAIDARLPTSDEFTKAAGGDKGYPWGATWPPKTVVDLSVQRGDNALPADVSASKLDVTPDKIHDLFANVSEWTSTVSGGLATIRGGEADQSLTEARTQFHTGIQKVVAEGDKPVDHAMELADPLTGFRCAR